jgi:hypothetical protein
VLPHLPANTRTRLLVSEIAATLQNVGEQNDRPPDIERSDIPVVKWSYGSVTNRFITMAQHPY